MPIGLGPRLAVLEIHQRQVADAAQGRLDLLVPAGVGFVRLVPLGQHGHGKVPKSIRDE